MRLRTIACAMGVASLANAAFPASGIKPTLRSGTWARPIPPGRADSLRARRHEVLLGVRRVLLQLLITLAVLAGGASAFFYGRVREEDLRVDGFARASTRGAPPADTEAVALALSREVFRRTNRRIHASELPLYERLESASFFNVTSAVSLEHGAYGLEGQAHYGPCGTMTRVTLSALDRLGISARKLHLHDERSAPDDWHTLLEFRSDGRWLVLSPSDSAFVWRRHDGRIATLDEIRADSTIFGEVFERFPSYPYRLDDATHIRWEKLPRAVRAFFRLVLGQERYENAFTPRLYDQPRRLFLLASLAAVCGFSLGILLVWGSGRERLHP